MPYPKTTWEEKNLAKKKAKPITNAFAYNPQKVISPSKHQKGTSDVLKDLKTRALAAGKRISKNGNVYYEYRKNRSDINGKLKV